MALWEDVRFAARLMLKDRWFTLVAAIALALGIGVNTTVFTFVNAVLIRGLPIEDSERVMALGSFDPVRSRDMGVSYQDFRDWRESTRTFESLAAYMGATANLSDEGRPPERYAGTLLTANAFGVMRQRPILGRDFLPEDDRPGAAGVVILGYGVWQNRYGGDLSVIGRAVRINDVPSIVVGVMPEGFKFPQNADLWQPLGLTPDIERQARNARNLGVFGRLAPGTTRAQAQAEMASIGLRLATEHPETNTDIQPRVMTFNERMNGGAIRAVFLSLMGAVAFVLLIACANVANLLLARSAQRSREISVRVALGASRWRVVRQLLIESVMLAVFSGAIGLAISLVGIRLFDQATQDVGRPYWIQFTMDGGVFAFLAAICLGTGILFGLAPALHVSKTDVNDVLKEGGRSGTGGGRARRWTAGLMVAEIALTVVLLAGAAFMMRNFLTLYSLDLGIDTSRLSVMRLSLPERKYPAIDERLAFYERLDERLRANSRIEGVTVASNAPLQGGFLRRLTLDGAVLERGEQAPEVTMLTVGRGYFETLGLPLLRGRSFAADDGLTGRESAIVNQRFAELHFPNDDPIGRRIALDLDLQGSAAPGGGIPLSLTATVVGIVPNVRQRHLSQEAPDPIAYVPFRMDPRGSMVLLARSAGDPGASTALLREEVRAVDADLPLYGIQTMDQALAQARWPFRIFGSMFAIFAFIALTLSAVGLYAVTAYAVTQRTQEIGLRMALGARSGQVAWLFMKRGVVHLAIGLAIGVAGAYGVGRLFESTDLLVQSTARAPLTIGGIAFLLAVIAVAACTLPARRAALLDPLLALRHD